MNEMPTQLETNAAVIATFRENKGEVPAPYDDPPPMLLLHTIGAKSGKEHLVPMRCLPDGETPPGGDGPLLQVGGELERGRWRKAPEGESLYVFGSAHGSERNPDWYHNLVAHPDITIEIGTETISVHATELHGEERDEIFARQTARFPIFAEYARKLNRTIPVIRLERLTPNA
jgi:deazaflavin-dependent oxidoreductase (nitroreductase family)